LSSEGPWRVVLLNNADFLRPASTIRDQTLLRDAPRQIDFYGESLDLLRFPHQIEPEVVALLRKKYEGTHVDLVLARAAGGLEFAARHPITGSGLANGQPFPSLNEMDKPAQNPDGTTDVYVGPKSPGNGKNYVATLRGKGFFFIFRLYGPKQAFFDKTWKPNDIEKVK
jgi:hypothetical protein